MVKRYKIVTIRVRPHIRKRGKKKIKVKGYTRKIKVRNVRKKGKNLLYWRPDRGWSKVDLEKDRKYKAKRKRTKNQPTWKGDLPGKRI